MCSTPLTINGYEVSCRECNQCVATYKNSWVARCVAEKQTMSYAYAITLTYADITEEIDGEWVTEPPLGARVYRYKDVSDMWKRIRSAGKRKWSENIELRYVIVGEKGTKYGRCHYHGVLFSSHPIIELGEISDARGNGFAYKKRLNWSIWGHGFVEFQKADRKGMSYALKYILKARMTAARSKGYAREGKTEWLASSYLWCSKKPSIAATWLWKKLNELVSKGMCPPGLRVRVPGGGDWYVGGKLQMEMCLFLHQANNEYLQARGRNLAGWSTLLESVQDEIEIADTGELVKRKPWEWLSNGEEQEEQNTELPASEARAEFERFMEWYAGKRRNAAPITNARAVLRKCGNILPCEECAADLEGRRYVNLKQEYKFRFEEWVTRYGHKGTQRQQADAFEEWWRTRLRPSRGCAIRDTDLIQVPFRRLIPVTKAQHGLTAKGAVGKALRKET